MKNKVVVLVDQNDKTIGKADMLTAHIGSGKLHRAISVFLFRRKNNKIELLIQQRSDKKITASMMWANTVCGHLMLGESHLECAKRRLKQELGISSDLDKIYVFKYQVQCDDKYSENEVDHVFAGWYDGDEVEPNTNEVVNYQWVGWDGFESTIKKYDLAPWFKLMLQNKDLINQLNSFIKL